MRLIKHLFPELITRVRKSGQPPGTAVFTGKQKMAQPRVTAITYAKDVLREASGTSLSECTAALEVPGNSWLDVTGLHDTTLIEQIAQRYHLHPLTVEDILNVAQRPKVEEFPNYLFAIIKVLIWDEEQKNFSIEQLSLVLGKDFLLSFQESDTTLFTGLRDRMHSSTLQRIQQNGIDYLGYRLIDTVVDQYFVVLEALGEQIEELEDTIITTPSRHNSRMIYQLKREILLLRKVLWPARQAINHLLQSDDKFVSSFTQIYLRDVYDHITQAIDTLEMFRDMISGILDVYLSALSNRLNEVMKVLTIIATIFIPITFIASIYGMNFRFMPELNWPWGYPGVLLLMLGVVLFMLGIFWRKKWF